MVSSRFSAIPFRFDERMSEFLPVTLLIDADDTLWKTTSTLSGRLLPLSAT
jgi:hypothetical protein